MQLIAAILAAAAVTGSAATPAVFEPNLGQTDPRVKFLAREGSAQLWLTEGSAVLGVRQAHGTAVLTMRFEGAARLPKIEAEDPRSGTSNYFVGRRETGWRTGIPRFGKVRYRGVYPGVDIVFYGNPEKFEYDFVLAAGIDPAKIRLAFDGADRMTLDPSGDLVLQIGGVTIRNRKPVVYQRDYQRDYRRDYQGSHQLEGRYVMRGKRSVGFEVERYDPAQPLVIDPVLTYATYLGGSAGEQVTGSAIDPQGNIYLVGITNSVDFPLKGALFPTKSTDPKASDSNPTAFLTKISPSSSGAASVIYSTYFGGDSQTFGYAVAVDRSGSAYITGQTGADDLPQKNPFHLFNFGGNTCTGNAIGSFTCLDAFVAKFSPAGDALVYSSYLGGTNLDGGNGIAVDAAGNAYVVGQTQSLDFLVTSAPYQATLRGGQNGFLSIVSTTGVLLYSTYFGLGLTTLKAVAVDSAGIAYMLGNTSSAQGPTTAGALQPQLPGLGAAIVAKLNPNLNGDPSLLYCTFLGGANGITTGYGIAADTAGNVYVAGGTTSTSFPLSAGAARTTYADLLNLFTPASGEGFVTKLNPAAQGSAQLAYSTLVGGSFDDSATGIAVDSAGRITVIGISDSIDLVTTPDALQCCYIGVVQTTSATQYGFLARYDPSKSGPASLVYSTLLGGSVNTLLSTISEDAPGNIVVVAGRAESNDTPVTPGAFQPQFAGQLTANSYVYNYGDAYMARFDFSTAGPVITQVENGAGLAAISPTNLAPGLIFAIKGTGLGPVTAVGLQIDANTGKVSSSVAGVQVLVDGAAAPLTYVSATQINVVAPYEIAGKIGQNVRVQVAYNGLAGNLFSVPVAATAPAIFSFDDGSGPGAVLNADLTLNSSNNPASRGSVISLYATGEGQTNPTGIDGRIANDSLASLPRPTADVSVTIGGVPAEGPAYAGTVPTGIAGFFQVNVRVPQSVPPGTAVPVVLTVGGVSSPKTLTMAVQ